jgi:thiol-disulfide isomerase/thioredoxin
MKKALFFISFLLILSCKESKKIKISNGLDSLEYLVDLKGSTFDVSSLKGKKVLINYWATWCAPCKKEMPDLLDAQEILSKENYVFLLVSDESEAQILEFKKQTNYKFTFLRSSQSVSNIGIYALPTTFVYNENGEKTDKIIGAVKWNSEKMIDKLKNIK